MKYNPWLQAPGDEESREFIENYVHHGRKFLEASQEGFLETALAKLYDLTYQAETPPLLGRILARVERFKEQLRVYKSALPSSFQQTPISYKPRRQEVLDGSVFKRPGNDTASMKAEVVESLSDELLKASVKNAQQFLQAVEQILERLDDAKQREAVVAVLAQYLEAETDAMIDLLDDCCAVIDSLVQESAGVGKMKRGNKGVSRVKASDWRSSG